MKTKEKFLTENFSFFAHEFTRYMIDICVIAPYNGGIMKSKHLPYKGFRRLEDWSVKRYLGHHFSAFRIAMTSLNLRRLVVINALMMVTEVILLLLPEPGIAYDSILWGFIAGNAIILPALIIANRQPLTESDHWHRALVLLDLGLIYTLTIGLTLATQGSFDHLHLVIGTMFVMVAVLYLPGPVMGMILGGVVGLFAVLLPRYQPDPNQQFILVNNLIIFALGAWVVGFLINRDRATTFKAKQELEELLKHDLMTQLYNHDTILDLIAREIEAAKADHQPLSMLMLDLDDFKAINDRHGHLKGDEVLLHVVEVLRKSTRSTDLIGRYGGEEFLIVFTRTELPIAQKISERIRGAIEAVNITGITVTVSGGLSQLNDESAEAFIKLVDDKLYEAKRAGKNRIITT